MKVPKKLHEFIRQHTVMSVVIREKGASGKEYLGTGVVKKIILARNEPYITVIFQIDVIDPLDRKCWQSTPK